MNKVKLAFANIAYLFKTANQADKFLMPVMLAGIIMDCAMLFIDTIMPKYIIDGLSDSRGFRYVLLLVLLTLFLRLVANISSVLLEEATRYKKERLIQQHYKQFSDKTMSLDLQDVEDPETSDQKEKAQRIITWNSMNIDGIKNALGGILSYGIQILGFAYIISTLNFTIILSVIAVMLMNAVFNNYRNKRSKTINDGISSINRMWKYLNRTSTDYSFGKIIRVDNLAHWLLKKCTHNRDDFLRENRKLSAVSFKVDLLSNALSLIQEGFVYIFLVFSLLDGKISYGDFFMYVSAVMAFTNAMKNIVGYVQGINYTGRYVNDYRNFLAIPEKLTNGEGVSVKGGTNCIIRFENVSFHYPNSSDMILKNINLVITGNSKISIVGDNGAGKTTFIKLLLRLYDPVEGNIYFNDINIKDLNTAQYRSLFSVVFQDYQMFPFTIAENIVYNETLNREAFDKALENVGMLDKVKALAKQENTYIGKEFDDDGTDFSGGEIQKFALARSLYRDAKVNILDEPTANISPIAEFQIYNSYHKFTSSLAIFISHRMSSSKFCDRVLVFDHGEIAEDGTHSDLMASDGLYAKMYSMQASLYLENREDTTNEISG